MYINLFLIFIIVILLYLNFTVSEKFSSQIENNSNLRDMMQALANSEILCDEIEKRQQNKDMLNQFKINKETVQQLSTQRQRIEELRRVLNHLRKQKEERDFVVNKCKAKAQKELNKDYTLVSKLAEEGHLKDTSLKVDLNISDQLKKNLKNFKNNSSFNEELPINNSKKNIKRVCKNKDPRKFIHKDNLNGKCMDCDTDTLLKSINKIKRDFPV